jgi:hypothetical protein
VAAVVEVVAGEDDPVARRAACTTADDAALEAVVGSLMLAVDPDCEAASVRATELEVASADGFSWLLGAEEGATAAAMVATLGREVARVR